jgi:hypothetical protein
MNMIKVCFSGLEFLNNEDQYTVNKIKKTLNSNFSNYGTINGTYLFGSKKLQKNTFGHGHVFYHDRSDAERAIKGMNNK